jgi:hypothetical protein
LIDSSVTSFLPPSPHPLDFDWRFSATTANKIVALIAGQEPILALGAPSIARILEGEGTEVTLVDRQPLQGVERHIAEDVVAFRPSRIFQAAIVDPPWYPDVIRDWLAVAAHAVQLGGTILVSVWPENTRPTARNELAALRAELARWASLDLLSNTLDYEVPGFELIAGDSRRSNSLSQSPRIGQLWKLTVRALPALPQPRAQNDRWKRFIINDYQLAIRTLPAVEGPIKMTSHPNADGWLWPFVSARAPGRDAIAMWSSGNEVALLTSPDAVVDVVRRALTATEPNAFTNILKAITGLETWKIPRPPFWRVAEWTHPR